MDVPSNSSFQLRWGMTIAEKTTNRSACIADLRSRVEEILERAKSPMSLAMIEACLTRDRIAQTQSPGVENTFDVREAVSNLIDDGKAEYTIGRQIRLTR
jgi:hypothetical protein